MFVQSVIDLNEDLSFKALEKANRETFCDNDPPCSFLQMTYFPGQVECWRCSPSKHYFEQTMRDDTQNFLLKIEFAWVGLLGCMTFNIFYNSLLQHKGGNRNLANLGVSLLNLCRDLHDVVAMIAEGWTQPVYSTPTILLLHCL